MTTTNSSNTISVDNDMDNDDDGGGGGGGGDDEVHDDLDDYLSTELSQTEHALEKLEDRHRHYRRQQRFQGGRGGRGDGREKESQTISSGKKKQNHHDDEDDDADILAAFGLDTGDDDGDDDDEGDKFGFGNTSSSSSTVLERLQKLEQTTETLCFVEDVMRWMNTTTPISPTSLTSQQANAYDDDGEHGGDDDDDDSILGMLLGQSEQCITLANDLLLKYGSEYVLMTYSELYTEAYLPMYQYVHDYCVGMLRQKLQQSRYPHIVGCRSILSTTSSSNTRSRLELSRLCQTIHELEETHRKVVDVFEGGTRGGMGQQQSYGNDDDTVLITLFQPILDRVHHHFVVTVTATQDAATNDHGDGVGSSANETRRLMATRTERLPEWLLQYLQKYALVGSDSDSPSSSSKASHIGPCPYQVAVTLTQGRLAVPFLQEMVQLIKWVLVDERKYFQHPSVAGPNSNPDVLYNSIQHFLEFDKSMKKLLSISSPSSSSSSISPSTTSHLMGLMDVIVMADNDLMHWWMEREREYVFRTLFEDDHDSRDTHDGNDDENVEGARNDGLQVTSPMAIITSSSGANHVSRRAEIFCALIRSVRFKAALLSSPGLYLRDVAVPLCSQFVDALRETSIDLRQLLVQQQRPATKSSSTTETQIRSNIHTWIELTNGCHLASRVLDTSIPTSVATAMASSTPSMSPSVPASQSDHDLARFGRSLQTLSDVLVEEFTKTFVDTVLMEQTKFASYLMTASHLLASQEWDDDTIDDVTMEQLSVELKDTSTVLDIFLGVCQSIILQEQGLTDVTDGSDEGIASFAPSRMIVHVLNTVAEKLLEVALDASNVTPQIWKVGATIFSCDVKILLRKCSTSTTNDLPLVDRLMDVTELMTMDFTILRNLFIAMEGLVGADTDGFLDVNKFTNDQLVYEEAMSMLKAKNIYCPIEDVISILNRRQD